MYTLRLAPALLHELDVEAQADLAATTRLGDWDVAPCAAVGRSLLVCVSDRSDLPIVLPRPDLGDLPEALGIALVPVLRMLGVDDQAIASELDEMATGLFGMSSDRSRQRRVRTLAQHAATWIQQAQPGPVDVVALHAQLAARRSSRTTATIAARTRALFGLSAARR